MGNCEFAYLVSVVQFPMAQLHGCSHLLVGESDRFCDIASLHDEPTAVVDVLLLGCIQVRDIDVRLGLGSATSL